MSPASVRSRRPVRGCRREVAMRSCRQAARSSSSVASWARHSSWARPSPALSWSGQPSWWRRGEWSSPTAVWWCPKGWWSSRIVSSCLRAARSLMWSPICSREDCDRTNRSSLRRKKAGLRTVPGSAGCDVVGPPCSIPITKAVRSTGGIGVPTRSGGVGRRGRGRWLRRGERLRGE